MEELKVVYRRTEDLIPYINNARTHDERQINQIAASIKEFGFNNPILLDGASGAMSCLKPERFAVIVMSNVRGRDGFYLDICEEIKHCMKDCGAGLYNELILVNVVGSSAVRAAGYFKHRKCVRTHQEVLVFYKGNQKNIAGNYPDIELPDKEELTASGFIE